MLWYVTSTRALPFLYLVNAILMSVGFPSSYGVFLDYYATHPPFEGKRSLAVVGPLSNVGTSFPLQRIFQRPSP